MSIPITGPESLAHQKAKLRLFQIVKQMGMVADFEIRTGTTETALGKRNFTADIFAFWYDAGSRTFKKIIFEVDWKHHNTERNINRDNNRDKAHKEKGIQTVRILTPDLIGKKKIDDATIKADILWQLNIQK